MSMFRKNKRGLDALEQKLNTISELTKGLDRTAFNNLIDAVKAVYEVRQKLRRVKTDDEKESEDIDEIERKLEKESK